MPIVQLIFARFLLVVLANLSFLAVTPLPGWLDPLVILSKIRAGEDSPVEFLPHLAAWGCVGIGCLTLAADRLRRVCLQQLQQRPSRWLWTSRPKVSDDPICWRERYVIGLAPFPWLRGVPAWLALLGVFGFSAILAGSAIDAIARGLFPALRAGDFARAWNCWLNPTGPDTLIAEVSIMGSTLLLLAGLVVGVRCGTSVAEEKRRKTWDDLLLTGEPLKSILRSKQWGVLFAAVPYLIAYSVPMFVLGSLGGLQGLVLATIWLDATWIALLLTSLVFATIPEQKQIEDRRSGRRKRPRQPLEGATLIKEVPPVEGADLIDECADEMTEEEVVDFLRNEPKL